LSSEEFKDLLHNSAVQDREFKINWKNKNNKAGLYNTHLNNKEVVSCSIYTHTHKTGLSHYMTCQQFVSTAERVHNIHS